MVLLDMGVLGLLRRVSPAVPGASWLHPVPLLQLPPWVAAALWGGGGAMVLGHLLRKLAPGPRYWSVWILLGAVLLTAAALGIGRNGWSPAGVTAMLEVNGAWGLCTAALLRRFGVQR